MFQCLGLATEADGGCGEDWWHPECVLGLGRGWSEMVDAGVKHGNGAITANDEDEDSGKLPPGFPQEDDFETFICYKCVEAQPWIRRYAASPGFLPAVYYKQHREEAASKISHTDHLDQRSEAPTSIAASAGKEAPSDTASDSGPADGLYPSRKRKAEDAADDLMSESKKYKKVKTGAEIKCQREVLPEPPPGRLSLFLKEDFRDHMCRCPACYPTISKHPQLLEEEESYEPPLSENGEDGNRSAGTGSLLDRGEAALSNVDRVRAIGRFQSSRCCISELTSLSFHQKA